MDSVYEGPLQPNDQVLTEDVSNLQTEVQNMLSRIQVPHRKLLVSFTQKRAFECSSDCFSVEEFSVQESSDCQKDCFKSLNWVKSRQEIAFAQFDVRTI